MTRTALLGTLLLAFACGGAEKQDDTMPSRVVGTDTAETGDMTASETGDMTASETTEPMDSSENATTPTPAKKPVPMPRSNAEVVFFDFDSAALTDGGKKELGDEIAWLSAHPKRHIILHGYTDDVGTPSYNLTLGNARANAVRTYMNSQGIELVRLHVVSHGESGPELPDEQERRALFVGTIKK